MPEPSVIHGSFTLERIYDAPPARVFQAFADPRIKPRWFHGPGDWVTSERAFDFRVGGREHNVTGPKGGTRHEFNCLYHDIVPDRRIIYSYDMRLDETRISVSLATICFAPAGAGTRLNFTEQGAFLDGYDDSGQREQGTGWLLDNLATVLAP